MTYDECVKYIYSIPKFGGIIPPTDTWKKLCALADTDKLGGIIHVAGTNGKGSVCAFLANILQCSGYKVGVFTSPHLVDMRERIAVSGEYISEDDFVFHCEKIRSYLTKNDCATTFFEVVYLIAMSYYSEQELDYIILETGLGGRYDATNSVENKVLSIITEIGLDHMQVLGNTIEKIAYEKAGIIRRDVPLVYVSNRDSVDDIIRSEYAKNAQDMSKCFSIHKENICITEHDFDHVKYNLKTECGELTDITINSGALYQTENASLAILGAKLLRDERITDQIILKGIEQMVWPGRMEKIGDGIYLDGAHNEDGIEAMLETAASLGGGLRLLFAVVNDKNYLDMITRIVESNLFKSIVITRVGGDRATDVDEIRKIFLENHSLPDDVLIETFGDVRMAYDYCLSSKGDDKLIIAGSLYLVGEIKSIIQSI